ncbi:helix-turn-helix domain-containing protein [Novosphingobium olei]|uniref:helix-turn-helix domain-containing protein n=1 Tax=Novosphingobium olei TaxID=2728851 RepID=UPI0030912DB6|nr:helix-turn-helix domain-containing protein [Novosphingobium olei]
MTNGSRAVAEGGGNESLSEGGELVAGPFASAGSRLRAAREAQGLSIADIAGRTRITARHIAAIESSDFATLPGRPYVLGFARSYAREVGLQERDIADAIRRELDAATPEPEPRKINQFEVGDPAKTPSRLLTWLAVLLGLGVVVLGFGLWRSYYWPAAELPPLVGPSSSAPASPAAKPAAPAAAPAPATGPVVFTALEDRIWVKFSDASGQQLMQKQMAKGESYTVPAEAKGPVLWTGRPDALAITVGGKAVARLAEKEGIVKNVAVDGAALLARPAVPAPAMAPAAATAPASSPAPAARRARTPVRAPAPEAAVPAPAPAPSLTSSTTAN